MDRFRQSFLRRFDLEHTFRFAKQRLGWTTPKLRMPEAADRWTWLPIVSHTQLRLGVPEPTGTGPGRPPGAKNKHPAPRYDVGKTVERPETLKAIGKLAGPGR
ncbi:hypothetical protein GCM10010365_73960 [Streptomyces poonensis]|uniref:Transposase n=1 Tax=Streptomyces poonensis TaxID=68255 RepID=A0A918QDU5_9ACTN|nr:hypothetical protein GCM10010365_73960 [Streptomyces poonensis]GLJ92762.1 hypothetical protein GCM10017589_53720 [Streptomyces poonensis]